MDGLVLSIELIKFLNWLVENKKELLESIIKSAAQENVFAPTAEKSTELDGIRLHQMITRILRSLEESITKCSTSQENIINDFIESLEALDLHTSDSGKEKLRIELLKKAGLEFSSNSFTAKA